jgi:hypothetical protein
MDLSEAAETLYGLPRADFTPARDEQVRAARAAGDRELATAIGKLRRPTVAAWLANQLAREQPDAIADLADLGDALRTAHHELDGAALRELSQRRHALVNELLGSIRELGRDAGQPVNEPAVRELEEMFTAALAAPEAARAAASGRLASTKDVADPDALNWPGADPGATPKPAQPRAPRLRSAPARAATKETPKPASGSDAEASDESPGSDASRGTDASPGAGRAPRPDSTKIDPAVARARMNAAAELDRLTAAADQAESAADETERELETAAETEKAAHRRVAELRTELTAAEQHEQRSREAARTARRAAEDAVRALRDARRRQEIAAQRLAALSDRP